MEKSYRLFFCLLLGSNILHPMKYKSPEFQLCSEEYIKSRKKVLKEMYGKEVALTKSNIIPKLLHAIMFSNLKKFNALLKKQYVCANKQIDRKRYLEWLLEIGPTEKTALYHASLKDNSIYFIKLIKHLIAVREKDLITQEDFTSILNNHTCDPTKAARIAQHFTAKTERNKQKYKKFQCLRFPFQERSPNKKQYPTNVELLSIT